MINHTCSRCGHRSGAESLRRDLYLGQRTIGDLQALQRGPYPFAKRIIRRKITRSLMRGLWGN